MAWFKGLAYKAEDLLNKIDKNAAEALQQDKARKSPSSEKIWENELISEQINSLVSTNSPFIRSNQEHLRRQQPAVDDAVGSPVHVNNTSNMNIQESVAIARKKQANVINGAEVNAEISISFDENKYVPKRRRSISSINEQQLIIEKPLPKSLSAAMLKDSLNTTDDLGFTLSNEQFEETYADVDNSTKWTDSEHFESVWAGDDENEPVNVPHNAETSVVEEKLHGYELLKQEANELKQQIEECKGMVLNLQKELESSRNTNQDLRTEHDHYKIRAQRILNEKEHIISELRKGAGVSQNFDEATVLELKAMRQEREFLREENAQITARLKALRDELLEAEKRFDAFRDQAADVQRGLISNLETERVSRQAAEEDCKAHAEELRGMRSDIAKQRSALMSKLQDREAELTRLRTQLSQKLTPQNAELGSRLQVLTNTLVQKQNTLEMVLTERNSLRLQLETLEKKYREALNGAQHSQIRMIPISNGDDGRSHVPSMFVESPFDTTMTRRVKKAYSSLDAVSIRTGVFLRRYPLARIVVFSYVVLLHLWVMFVLLSNSPQS